jgi:hypothetical protein
MSVPKKPERESITLPRRSVRTIDVPLRRIRTITYSNSPTKNLTCILCNKTLNVLNTDHACEVRPCVDEFSIKFT